MIRGQASVVGATRISNALSHAVLLAGAALIVGVLTWFLPIPLGLVA